MWTGLRVMAVPRCSNRDLQPRAQGNGAQFHRRAAKTWNRRIPQALQHESCASARQSWRGAIARIDGLIQGCRIRRGRRRSASITSGLVGTGCTTRGGLQICRPRAALSLLPPHNELTLRPRLCFSEHFVCRYPMTKLSTARFFADRQDARRRLARSWANLRANLSFMWSHPGKKPALMWLRDRSESEWGHDGKIDWDAVAGTAGPIAGLQMLVRDLNTAPMPASRPPSPQTPILRASPG